MIREILVLHHSHTDVGFTHPQPVWWELSRRYIDEALDLCERTRAYPEEARLRWTCENTAPVLHWLERAPARRVELFQQAVRDGQIGVAALPYNLTSLLDLEQVSRSLQPVARLRQEFGLPLRCAIAHDVNGVAWPVAQLLLDAGVELLITGINAHFGSAPIRRPLVFNWQTMDGRKLLSHNGLTYTTFDAVARMQQLSVTAMAEGVADFLKRIPADYPFDFILLTATHRPWHNDNNPPNPWLPDLIRAWNEQGREPRIRMVLPEQYLETLRQQPTAQFPTYRGDWTDYWTFGVGSAAFETRVSQKTRARLAAAGLARAAAGRKDAQDGAREAEGYTALNLWGEHTWASDDSLTGPESDYSHEHWAHKLSYLYQARSQAQLVMRDQLEALAGNPDHGRGLKGLLMFNPAPVARKELIRLPGQVSPGAGGWDVWMHFSSLVMRLDQYLETPVLKDQGVWVGPVEVPANGWRVIPVDGLQPAQIPDSIACGEGWLESSSHRLRYDAASGRVLSLVDKATGWDAIDAGSPWDFGGLVWEHLGADQPIQHPHYGREAFFQLDRWDRIEADEECWKTDWAGVYEKPAALVACQAELTPRGAVLTRRWQGAGVEDFEEKIVLLAHRPVVSIEAQFRLPERIAAEAYYLTFPLNLAEWRAFYDTAELPVELDAEQLPGVCRDWQCVSRWASLTDGAHGATLACPDAPLVQLGGFQWARHQRSIPRQAKALALGWLTNNYWNCNFPAAQPGSVRFRYELATHGAYDPARSMALGLEAAAALEVHPVLGDRLAETGQVIAAAGENVVHLYTGLEADGAIRVRLFNAGEQETRATLTLPGREVSAASRVDTLGQPVGPAPFHGERVWVDIPARALVQLKILV